MGHQEVARGQAQGQQNAEQHKAPQDEGGALGVAIDQPLGQGHIELDGLGPIRVAVLLVVLACGFVCSRHSCCMGGGLFKEGCGAKARCQEVWQMLVARGVFVVHHEVQKHAAIRVLLGPGAQMSAACAWLQVM